MEQILIPILFISFAIIIAWIVSFLSLPFLVASAITIIGSFIGTGAIFKK